ncbi:MAG: UTP--glucose-1-phosphate uridylyltransferase GalU [Rhodospirillaceae bacterium]|nr:UTP--glucose-1-phosphate uridylyltransferase GalU [Rhodospirillaceae bacterium]
MVRTAVFPVAGRGSRFLPATKATPKEMFPIVDKPLIQYAVEEAVAAGAEKLIFVTAAGKGGIEDHFDVDVDLEQALEESGKDELLASVRGILSSSATCIFLRQGVPLGLGHAVLCARAAVGDEPFYVHLPDDLIHSATPCLEQMREHHERHGGSVLAVQTVPGERTANYGIVAVEEQPSGARRIKGIVEKPKPADAPSNLAVVGRYLLTPRIFDKLETTQRGAGNEIQLTDGIASLMKEETVHALAFDGVRYDCGTKLGYLQALVEYGLRDEQIGQVFRKYLDEQVQPTR